MTPKNLARPNKIFKNRFNFAYSLMLLIMWIFFGWNTSNADFLNYKHIYDIINYSGGYSGVEFGFEFVMKLSNYLGLSYYSFLKVYSLLGLLFITSSIKKYSNNSTLVLFLYLVYPYLLDVVQIRNFMAMAIMVYGIRFLVSRDKKSSILYIISIMVASSFHYSALFYLVFLLVRIKKVKKIFAISLFVIISGFLTSSVFSGLILNLLRLERYQVYFVGSTSLYGKALFVFYFIASTILIYFIYKKIIKIKENARNNSMYFISDEQYEFADVVMKINILILISYVLVYLDVDFVRIYRNILPLNYILFSIIKPKGKFEMNLNVFLHSWFFLAFVVLSSGAFVYYQTFDSVVLEILFNNSFLEIFRIN